MRGEESGEESDRETLGDGRLRLARRRPFRLAPSARRGLLLLTCLGAIWGQAALAQAAEPVPIPLKHVTTDGDDDYDSLGVMVGINDGPARLFELDTGSDQFNAQIDELVEVEPLPDTEPALYAYGDGTYGNWVQRIRFDSLSYYDPDDPSEPIVTFDGGHVAGQILDIVYTEDYAGFKDLKRTGDPVGYDDETPLYADLEVRERILNGEPGEMPPLYGIFGAGDFLGEDIETSALGGRTRSGYVISANANLGEITTPGCGPCLTLHLSPNVRAQFSALVPWGKLDYQYARKHFPPSGAPASAQFEGTYSYTISVEVGGKKHAIDFKGPILFDSGTPDFIYVVQDKVLKKLRTKGFKLAEDSDGVVDFKIHGFKDTLNNQEFDEIGISRLSGEGEGDGVIIGLPFFQANSIMYDLENRTTAFTPFFVTVEAFTTDASDAKPPHLGRVTGEMGSVGWLGVAGVISGAGDFTIEKDAVVRLTGVNSYRGATHIADDGFLYLAGPGSIEQSERVVVDGVLNISQKGNYLEPWGVAHSMNDAVLRNLNGKGEVHLGGRRLVVTAAEGTFAGSITDYDDAGHNMGGGLLLAGGTLRLTGENDYSGVTEVAAGAELHVAGSLTGDVAVAGVLVIEGEIHGRVMVKKGGRLTGSGKVRSLTVAEGGRADPPAK